MLTVCLSLSLIILNTLESMLLGLGMAAQENLFRAVPEEEKEDSSSFQMHKQSLQISLFLS